MADKIPLVTKIKTIHGDAKIDYNALANKPKLEGYSTIDHTHKPEDIEGLELKVNETIFVPNGGTGKTEIADGLFVRGSGTNEVKLSTVDEVKTELGINFITYKDGQTIITPFADGSVKFLGSIDFADATAVVFPKGFGANQEGSVTYAVYS